MVLDLEWELEPLVNTMVQSFTVNCRHTADVFFQLSPIHVLFCNVI